MSSVALPHLLVPTNFGIASRIARWTAMDWALAGAAKISVIHVARDDGQAGGFDALRRLHDANAAPLSLEERRRRLDEMTRPPHPELAERIVFQGIWREGDVIREIREFVASDQVSTVIVGAAPRPFPWQSSLGVRLARRLSCRVVVVHEPPRRFAPLLKLGGLRIPPRLADPGESSGNRFFQ